MNTHATIPDFVVNDSKRLMVTLQALPFGVTVTEGIFTVRNSKEQADPGVFQKLITPLTGIGTGMVINDGSGDCHDALMRFDIESADSGLLDADVMYYYDIKVRTSLANSLNTIEVGTIGPIWGM